jgi:hypothetical protein
MIERCHMTVDRPARRGRVAAMDMARMEMVRAETAKGGRCC